MIFRKFDRLFKLILLCITIAVIINLRMLYNDNGSRNKKSDKTGREVLRNINNLNENFDVLNLWKFGPIQGVETVIVVQVHNRTAYLRKLIDSLQNVRHIEKTLLVFSHDVNATEINDVINNITFARVYQIFYPQSIQLFPMGFVAPGNIESANEPITRKTRNQARTQIKHHWWWKMNFVFDGIIERFALHSAWVILLEEDHFVMPDALHVLNKITSNKDRYCPECEIITLGGYDGVFMNYGEHIKRLRVDDWYSGNHNMGMALRYESWMKIKNCSDLFCNYDDYNWDWSLLHVSFKCLSKRFKTIIVDSYRVQHIGDCGTHKCAEDKSYKLAKLIIERYGSSMFPQRMLVTDRTIHERYAMEPNGGWTDERDRALCRMNTNPLDKDQWNDESNIRLFREMLNSAYHN